MVDSRYLRDDGWLQRVLLAAILVLAAVLRIYNLRDLPAGLFCDEAALGYNSWAVLHYGISENGQHWPLFFWSFGGYKDPVYIYSAMLPIGVLGLNEFSLRLTSALFGIGTVAGTYYLGRALFGVWVGLWAALLLAVCPWHLHFSRIAFELISFPFLFVIGMVFLIRFTQGRWTLPLAFFFFGACLYAYAVAKLFVPLFLIGFGLLYLPTVWRRWREWLVAVPVLLLTVAPVVYFDEIHKQGAQYFYNTTILQPGRSLAELARIFFNNYLQFVSPRFLFEQGDNITRHAVRGHGELYPFFAPFLLIGTLVLLLRRDRGSKLILWWLLLYPVGASLMNEVPSASRGFIGVVAFCMIAAVGLAAVLRAIGWIAYWRPLRLGLQAAAVAALGWIVAYPQVAHYMDLYFNEYVKYSAPTYGGFQYGYRDVIHYMDGERDKYPLMMLTATEVNQPYIFALFYGKRDPREFSRSFYPGYLILDPAEYRRYSMDKPILYSLREQDLTYFSDYDVKKKIVAPGGQLEFIIAEVRARKQFITDWLTLGLFNNRHGAGMNQDFIDVHNISKRRYKGAFGEIYWRPLSPQFIRIDLNQFYATQDPEHPGNPEEVCAYALTVADVPTARKAVLEMGGSDDAGTVWLNGVSLTPSPQRFGHPVKRRPVELTAGENTLIVKSCENIGSWYFTARLTDPQGNDMPDVRFRAEIPTEPPPAAEPPPKASDLQVIEGFSGVKTFRHTQDSYPDYRGGTRSWWAYTRDNEAEVSWETAPAPAKKPTAVVFTGSMGEQEGKWELWVNGRYVLDFETGASFSNRTWERGPYRMSFVSRQMVSGNSGMFVLTVPESAVEPGQPLELRVVPAQGDDNSWFMIKGYPDTAAFEHVTPESVEAVGKSDWQEG